MLIEEDDLDFALWSREGFAFVVPALGWAAAPYALCSALLLAAATAYLRPATVSEALARGTAAPEGAQLCASMCTFATSKASKLSTFFFLLQCRRR